MFENQLLKLLLSYEFYLKVKDRIPFGSFNDSAKKILDTIVWAHNTLKRDLSPAELKQLVAANNPGMTTSQKFSAETIVDNFLALPEIKDDAAKIVLSAAWKADLGRRIIEHGSQLINGTTDSITPLKTLLENTADDFTPSKVVEPITGDVVEMIKALNTRASWKFNIPTLASKIPGMSGGEFLVLLARPECFAKNTRILMADLTTKAVQDVVVGDVVLGPAGTVKPVVKLFRGEDTHYKITYASGDSYVVGGNHTICLVNAEGHRLDAKAEAVYSLGPDFWSYWRLYKSYCDADWKDEHPLHPYVLGAWLGDGDSRDGTFTSADPSIVSKIRKLGYKVTKSKNVKYKYYIRGANTLLRQLNVVDNKHVPQRYLSGSRSDRLQLLAGLIDTDGHIQKDSSVTIVQKNKVLANNILFLARSLGLHAVMKARSCRATNSKSPAYGLYWSVRIVGNVAELPLTVARKVKRAKLNSFDHALTFKFTMSKAKGCKPVYGFKVGTEDPRILLEDFSVTSNCGKTAYVINSIAGPGGFASQGAKVHIICNEEPAIRNSIRAVSSHTGMTWQQIVDNPTRANELYADVKNNIKFIDDVTMNLADLDRYCKQHKPDILVVDQLDRVSSGGNYESGHERLGEIYSVAREIAKRNNLFLIGVSQASAEAEGRSQVHYSMAEGSKTAKAATADVIIGIGVTPEASENNIRMLNVSKNKISGWHGAIPVKLQPELSRYTA